MGLDFVLYAPAIEGADLKAISALEPYAHVSLMDSHGRKYVVLDSPLRYWSEHYPRGHWPTIRDIALKFRAMVPGVRYATDDGFGDWRYDGPADSEWGQLVTDEFVSEMNIKWLEIERLLGP